MNGMLRRWSAASVLEAVAWTATLVVALGVPLILFAVELQYQRGTLATLADARAFVVNQRVTANPQMWRFEEHRLAGLLQNSMAAGDDADRRSVLDAEDRVLSEAGASVPLPAPVIEQRVALYDAGQLVGWVRIERSLRPQLLRTLWWALASVLGCTLVLGFLRFVPLRALRHAESELVHKAFHDQLTGLPNRDAFRRVLDAAVARSGRQGGRLAVLFVDLDRFKAVNDTLGHDAGDEVLRGVALRLRGCLRGGDTLARLSGDEFAILIDDRGGEPVAVDLADALIACFQQPFAAGARQWHLSCSIGVALFPQHALESDKLLAYADTAMLHAKNGGRSSRRVYSEDMQEGVARRVRIEDDLRGALERGEFVLHYQPLLGLAHGRVRGHEALLRWQHPRRGLVPPAEFVPILEDLGQIHAVGQWVLGEACRQMRAWRDGGAPLQHVAVNVSALQFGRGMEFVDQVRRALDESGLDSGHLLLELTEGVLMSDSRHSMEMLLELERLGVALAIDDFGTGYSSLAYLRSFPVAMLKVDRSFVRDMCTDPKDASIVKAIVQMAHSLGLEVTAEGIETAEQLAALRALGCDTGQGFLLGRPVPASAIVVRGLALA